MDENKQRARNSRLVMEYGNVVKKVASKYKLSTIDLASKMQEDKNFPEILNRKKSDGLHLGINGYKLLVNLIVKKINQIFN